MHAITDRAHVVNGKIEIRPIMVVALTYDHRLLDGREAVTFLGMLFPFISVILRRLIEFFPHDTSEGEAIRRGPAQDVA